MLLDFFKLGVIPFSGIEILHSSEIKRALTRIAILLFQSYAFGENFITPLINASGTKLSECFSIIHHAALPFCAGGGGLRLSQSLIATRTI